jgi:hypothetical protein
MDTLTVATMSLNAIKASDSSRDYFLVGDGGSGVGIPMDRLLAISGTGSGNIKTYSDAILNYSAPLNNIKGLLNGDYTGDLNYSVAITATTINNTDTDLATKSITADLLIVLPLYFDVEADNPATTSVTETSISIDGQKYIKVNMSMLDSISSISDEDLLAAVRPTLDEYAKITGLGLGVNVTNNDVFDGVYLGIKNGSTSWDALELDTGKNDSLTFNDAQINTMPQGLVLSFTILVKEGTPGSNTGALKLKPFDAGAGFDITISVDAKIDAHATLP